MGKKRRRLRAATTVDVAAGHVERGVAAFRAGDAAAAEAEANAALRSDPRSAAARQLLAYCLHGRGDVDAAAKLLEEATAIAPSAGAWSDHGNVLVDLGRDADAIESYRRALEIEPRGTATLAALGDAFVRVGRHDDAVDAFRALLALDVDSSRARPALFGALRAAKRYEEAKTLLDEWIARSPDDPVALHFRGALGGEAAARASDEYVRAVFDRFADRFDEDLSGLEYRAPAMIADAIAASCGALSRARVLDAGCGTGLLGPVLRRYASRLVGIDLSEGMLERARSRAPCEYDHLENAEITSYLEAHRGEFDLIAAADTFNYFGDLAPLFTAARGALEREGWLVFTLEAGEGHGSEDAEFLLQENGRYRHEEGYVRRRLGDAGFDVRTIERVVLRLQAGEPVAGWIIAAITREA